MPWFWKQKGKKCILKVYLTQINSTGVNLFDSWENVCFVEQKIQFLKSTVYWQHFICSIFCHFTEQWFPFGHSTIQCWLVECCRNGCPSGRFSQLQRALWEWTLGFLITYWLGLFYPNCSDWQPALGTILVLLPFTDDEGTCSVPLLHLRSDISLQFMAWFVLWHTLLTMRPTGLSKSYPVNWFYLQSNCRDVWQMISGNRIQLSLILSVLAKDMNTNVHVVFYLYNWKNFKQRSVWERSAKDHSSLSWNSRGCPGSARAGRRAGKLVKWAVEFSK